MAIRKNIKVKSGRKVPKQPRTKKRYAKKDSSKMNLNTPNYSNIEKWKNPTLSNIPNKYELVDKNKLLTGISRADVLCAQWNEDKTYGTQCTIPNKKPGAISSVDYGLQPMEHLAQWEVDYCYCNGQCQCSDPNYEPDPYDDDDDSGVPPNQQYEYCECRWDGNECRLHSLSHPACDHQICLDCNNCNNTSYTGQLTDEIYTKVMLNKKCCNYAGRFDNGFALGVEENSQSQCQQNKKWRPYMENLYGNSCFHSYPYGEYSEIPHVQVTYDFSYPNNIPEGECTVANFTCTGWMFTGFDMSQLNTWEGENYNYPYYMWGGC